ncbi:MAG TPA: alkaline phosphatase family protein, partial [Bryobacteraceae bacterium]|nr:alkaline phosphatase family protein [Bryobacteraceae bacterium]
GIAFPQASVQPDKPKLVVGIVNDQFRYDYLTRFRTEYTGGLARLLARGAVFTNARYRHFPTITAIGHSTFMTGATPSVSGIAGNEWYDREAGKVVTSVSDDATKLLGGKEQAGSSPRKLLVSTIGDELKAAQRGKARVVGISIKDRAAVLPSGHWANGAYWFDGATGNFVSSTFYFADLPQWVKDFNAARAPDRFLNVEWKPLVPSPDYPDFSQRMAAAASSAFYNSLEASPYGNELVEAFAERAIEGEQLGRRGVTDLLTVSFSSNDYVGHRVGPDAPQVRDMALRVDRTMAKLFEFIDKRVGLENTLVVFTADHGVAPLAEVLSERRMPGGRHSMKDVAAAVKTALETRFGTGDWVLSWAGTGPYLNRELIRTRKLDEAEVERAAAEAVASVPHIFRVLTREQMLRGQVPDDAVSRAALSGFFPRRSADLAIIEDPYWTASSTGATHGAPFGYDAHVPVIFMGPGLRPGRYDANIAPNDIAPTLATMLAIETPSGAGGRVLDEMWATVVSQPH